MKIGVVCPYDLSLPGGVQNIVLQMHTRLRQRGHDARIISVNPAKNIEVKETKFFGRATPITGNGASASFNFGSIGEDVEISRYLKNEQFEILVIHEPLAPFLNWEVLNFAGVPKIGWFHATTMFDPWEFPVNLLAEPVQVWLRSRLAGAVVISTSARDIWKKAVGKTGTIISGGVDTSKFVRAEAADLGDREAIKFLFVGRLDERKGLPDLIKAAGMITGRVNLRLWVVGNGPMYAEAWELAHRQKLGGKIRFVGRVSDADLPGYFKAADIYCAPSWGGESLGLVLLEAMAAGAPIIAYANPGYKYTLDGYPWKPGLVPVKSVKKLAGAMEELAGKADLRRELAEWGRAKAKEFDWEVMTDKLIEYADEVVGRRKRQK